MRFPLPPAVVLSVSAVAALLCGGGALALAAPITSDQIMSGRTPAKLPPEIEQAKVKFDQQQYEDALGLLSIAATRAPELPPGRAMLARWFFMVNQPQMGRAMLEQTIVESPNDPEAYRILGDLAFNERRLVETKLLFEKLGQVAAEFTGDASRKASNEAASHAGLAAVAEARKQWDIALEHLNAWLAKDPRNAGARHRLGQTLFGLERHDEAFKELQTAASLAKEHPAPEVTMGRLYHQAGKEDEAAIWMKKAIETSPDSLAARLGVAQWQWENGQLDEAQKNVDAALKIKPDSLDALVIAGLVNRYRKDLPAAEGHFQAAYLASPGNAIAANQLALVLIDSADEIKRRRALELAESNAKQFNNNPDVAATLGWIYLKNNRMDDATRVFRAVAGAGRINADVAYYMAVLSDRAGNTVDALKALKSAVEAKGPFAYRDEANSLLAKLESKAGGDGAATATDAKTSAKATTSARPTTSNNTASPKSAGTSPPSTRPATSKAGAGSKAPASTAPGSKAPASKAPARPSAGATKAGSS